jgi:outer membrane protein OmpA-like peptidoglycan-associated protein
MARYETYRSNAAEVPIMRKWLLRAFALSVLLHVGLFVFFQLKKLDNFSMRSAAQLAPPRWVLKQAVIDPKLLDEPEKIVVQTKPKSPATIEVPIEKPEPKEIQLSPQTTEITSPLLTDKPKAAPLNPDALARIDAESAGRADKELGSLATALLDKGVRNPRQPVIRIPKVGGDGPGLNEGIPGRQSLDEALTGTGGVAAGQKAVAMPGGALFEHDKAELVPSALDDLQKLAALVAKYPNATFIISGHTDWTGTPEYNQGLSERRADAVKSWLVTHAGVAPERIQTIGKGTSEAIVPADKSVEEQQPNRRVEIVIKTNRK